MIDVSWIWTTIVTGWRPAVAVVTLSRVPSPRGSPAETLSSWVAPTAHPFAWKVSYEIIRHLAAAAPLGSRTVKTGVLLAWKLKAMVELGPKSPFGWTRLPPLFGRYPLIQLMAFWKSPPRSLNAPARGAELAIVVRTRAPATAAEANATPPWMCGAWKSRPRQMRWRSQLDRSSAAWASRRRTSAAEQKTTSATN